MGVKRKHAGTLWQRLRTRWKRSKAGAVITARPAFGAFSRPSVRSGEGGRLVPGLEATGLAGARGPSSAVDPDPTPPVGRRPFHGHDREQAAYARLKPDLLTRAEGQYVVLVGDDVEGPVETFGDALRAGYDRFGLGPLFVKQVQAVDPVAETSRDL